MQFVVAEKTAYTGICQNKSVELGGEKVENSLCDKGYDLVAYAGYDKDLKIYTGSSNYFEEKGQFGLELDDLNKYRKYNPLINQFYTGTLSNGISKDLANYRLLGFDVNKVSGFSMYGWGKYATGIFLDTYGNDDYLKYDISPLSLSGSDFAIEMSVRGGALKRPTSFVGYLFTLGNGGTAEYTYDNDKLGFGISGGQIKSVVCSSQVPFLSPSALQDNNFYKVIVKLNTSENKAQICIDTNCSDLKSITGFSSSKFSNITNLFIGSGNNKILQWNDIIDYVKIYKR